MSEPAFFRMFNPRGIAVVGANVSEFAWLARDRLVEMDVNPVLVRPQGSGVVAADALIVVRNDR